MLTNKLSVKQFLWILWIGFLAIFTSIRQNEHNA